MSAPFAVLRIFPLRVRMTRPSILVGISLVTRMREQLCRKGSDLARMSSFFVFPRSASHTVAGAWYPSYGY